MDVQQDTINYIQYVLILADQKYLANNLGIYYQSEIDLMNPDNGLFLPLIHAWLQRCISYKITSCYADIINRTLVKHYLNFI